MIKQHTALFSTGGPCNSSSIRQFPLLATCSTVGSVAISISEQSHPFSVSAARERLHLCYRRNDTALTAPRRSC
jgi:hypothetical protein